MEWEEGKLVRAELRSRLGNPLILRYGDVERTMETEQGQLLRFDGEMTLL